MHTHLVISTSVELIRVDPEKIIYISSDGNYSTLVFTDGTTKLVTFQLGQIESLINSQLGKDGKYFIRIGKSLIINRYFIYVISVSKQRLELSDFAGANFTLTASKDALKQLKEYVEKEEM